MAQNGYVAVRSFILADEVPAQQRLNPERLEKTGRDAQSCQTFGAVVERKFQIVPGEKSEPVEHGVLIPIVKKVTRSHRESGLAGAALKDSHQPVRVGIGQGFEQHSVD